MKRILGGLLIPFFIFFAVQAEAGQFSELKKKLAGARESLLVMIKVTGKQGPAQQKVVTDTADAVGEMLATLKAPAGKEAQFKELTSTWVTFRKVREEEIIPLVLADRRDEAGKASGGAQKERYRRMRELCDELDR